MRALDRIEARGSPRRSESATPPARADRQYSRRSTARKRARHRPRYRPRPRDTRPESSDGLAADSLARPCVAALGGFGLTTVTETEEAMGHRLREPRVGRELEGYQLAAPGGG